MTSKFTLTSIFITAFIFVFLCFDAQLYNQIQRESRFNITITVKAVMLDHVNSYILQPLSEKLVDFTRFPYTFPWISANHISYLGVVFALIAAKLALSDQLYIRRIGVVSFFVRQFLDDLDGYVARFHLGIDTKKQVSLPNSSGYLVDGLCDGIGLVVFWLAVFHSAYTRQSSKSSQLQLNNYSLLQSNQGSAILKRGIVKHYFLLLFQMGLSSLFWNIFLIQYHQVLDPSLQMGFDTRTPLQAEIFKSSLMFMIMWLWRCLNPHALTDYFLVSVWLNKQTQYAKRSNQYFFWIILGLSFLCMVHLKDIKYRLDVTNVLVK